MAKKTVLVPYMTEEQDLGKKKRKKKEKKKKRKKERKHKDKRFFCYKFEIPKFSQAVYVF